MRSDAYFAVGINNGRKWRIMKKRLLLIALFLFLACSRDIQPLNPGDGDAFGFYFLADTTITLYSLSDCSEEKLQISSTPWLTANDINIYNYSTHTIQLKKRLSDLFPEFDTSTDLMQKWNVKPFYVVAGGEKIYVAAFHAAYSSLSNMVPYIDLLGADLDKSSTFTLQQAWADPDVRRDSRVERVLKELGIFNNGG